MSADLDFRQLFEASPACILVLDPELRVVGATDAYLRATLTSRDEMLGRLVFDVFPDDPDEAGASGVANLRSSLDRVREQRILDVMPIQKYAIPRADENGERFEIRYWAPVNAPVLGPDGELMWIVNRVEDITTYVRERVGEVSQEELLAQLPSTVRAPSIVHARARLLEQNHALHAVLDSLDVAVVGCDRHARAMLTNRAARDLFKLPDDGEPREGWGYRFAGFTYTDPAGNPIAAEDRPIWRLLRGERVQNTVMIAATADAPDRVLRIHGKQVTGDGSLAAVVAIHDITREHRAERLEECERQVAKLLAKPEPADLVTANAVELIGSTLGWAATEFWVVDQVGQVLRRRSCWPAHSHDPDRLERGAGLPGRAWDTGEPVWDTGLPAGRRAALAVPIPGGAVVLGVLVCHSTGREIPGDMRAAVVTGIAAHLAEFLERRRAEQFAAELDATRDEYIALVGHELRTPLTIIQANAELLRTDPDLSPAERDEILATMHRGAGGLQTLIAKLLDVAGARSGHVTLDMRHIDLAVIARAAVQHAAGLRPPVLVELSTPPRVLIDGDPGRLRNVFDELLRNALTWAPENSTVGVTLTADEHTAVLAVTNAGLRITAEEHARVFDLFYRTEHALRQGIPGNGLGLTLARAIVEQHAGTITISEPEEATTTFTVHLPTHHAPA